MKARLTASSVDAFQPAEKMYKVWDTDTKGFFLRVLPSGRKTFALFYRQDGKGQDFTLGRYGQVSPEEAMRLAKRCLIAVHGGEDIKSLKNNIADSIPVKQAPTLGVFIKGQYADWLLSHQAGGRAYLRILRKDFAILHDKSLNDISHADVIRYQDEARQSGLKPVTINRRTAILQALLSRAQLQGLIHRNPLQGLLRLAEDNGESVRYLRSPEEATMRKALDKRQKTQRADRRAFNLYLAESGRDTLPELSAIFTDHLKPMVLLALNTGLKRNELFRITWEGIRPRQRTLFVKNKNGTDRKLVLNQEAFDVLCAWRNQTQSCGLVFPSPKTGRCLRNIGSSWSTLLEASGLHDFRFNDFQHTFAVNAVMSGIHIDQIAKWIGMDEEKASSKYRFFAPKSSLPKHCH